MALRFLNSGYFAGKVGIGVETPLTNLDILGTSDTYLTIRNNGGGFKSGIRMYGGTAGISNIWHDDTESNPPGIHFGTSANIATTPTTQLYIKGSDGNVGIGTTTPNAKLDVQGTQGQLFSVTDDLSGEIFAVSDISGVPIMTVNSSGLSTFDGNVNILSGALSITADGSNAVTLTESGNGDFTIDVPDDIRLDAGGGDIVLKKAGTEHGRISMVSSDLKITTSIANRDILMIPDGTGKVGIGTTSPGYKLEVNGNAAINSRLLLNSPDYNQHLNIRRGIYGYDTIVTGTRVDYSPTADTDTFKFLADLQTTGQLNVTGNSIINGNVGIGTTSPDFKLDVDGTVGVTGLETSTSTMSLMANETLSSELVTNGSFSSTSDWTAQLSANFTVSGGDATIISAGANSLIYQNISPSSANAILKITVNVVSFTGSSFGINFAGYSKSITETGTFTFYTTSSRTNSKLDINPSTNQTLVISEISVKEVLSDQIAKRELGTGAFGPTPVGAYLPLAGGTMTGVTQFNDHTIYGDQVYAKWGAGSDLTIGHNATNSVISNAFGNLYISNHADDKDIIFECDNGSGASVSYLTLDGGTTHAYFSNPGNVGIGVTDPGANLEIRGTVNQDDCKIYLKENGTYGAYFKYNGSGNRGWIGGITSTTTENAVMSWSRDGTNLKLITSGSTAVTVDSNRDVTFAEDIIIKDVLLSNQVNTDIDTGAEVVAQVAHATYTAAFFDFVVKKGTNVRSGTVYACHDGDTTPLVEFTETSTQDLGDTSDVVLSVDISGTQMRLIATVASDDWSVKSLIRAI